MTSINSNTRVLFLLGNIKKAMCNC